MFWNTDVLDFDVDLIQRKIFRTNYHEAGISWTPENPTLFDVEFEIIGQPEGTVTDKVFLISDSAKSIRKTEWYI
ncbi:MAG: hypothetical protein ACLRV8_04000 [Blautia hansenii]